MSEPSMEAVASRLQDYKSMNEMIAGKGAPKRHVPKVAFMIEDLLEKFILEEQIPENLAGVLRSQNEETVLSKFGMWPYVYVGL